MNPKINEILESMKQRPKDSPTGSSEYRTITGLSIDMAELLVLLAEESEKNAKKIEKLTKTLTILTWFIAVLTAFLVLSVFFEFPKYRMQFFQHPCFTTEASNKTNSFKNIQTLPEGSKTVKDVSK